MKYRVRFTITARDDLRRLYAFMLQQDVSAAKRALVTIKKSISLLEDFPFTCRKAGADNPFIRELLISFGSTGYVALFEIENNNTVTILAIRHQREDDYH